MNKRLRRKRQALRRSLRSGRAAQIKLPDMESIAMAANLFAMFDELLKIPAVASAVGSVFERVAHDPVLALVAKGYDQKAIEAVVNDPEHPDRKKWETIAALTGVELPRAGNV